MTSEFYERYKHLCKEHGESCRSAAIKMNISPASTTKWKNGSAPDTNTLNKLAKFFGITLNELMGYTEEPQEIPLTASAKKLVLKYNKLSEQDKQIVDIILAKYED